MSGDSRIVLMPYNDHWRVLRKTMHQILSGRSQAVFMPFQDLESKVSTKEFAFTTLDTNIIL